MMLIQAIGAIVAALLLDGDGGADDEEEKAWTERVAPRMSKLIDERIDAAFDRWLEKKGGGGGSGDGDNPPNPPKVDNPPNPPKPDEPPAPKRSPLLDLVFGAPDHRKAS